MQANIIEEALRNHSCTECLQWCNEHRSNLKKIKVILNIHAIFYFYFYIKNEFYITIYNSIYNNTYLIIIIIFIIIITFVVNYYINNCY